MLLDHPVQVGEGLGQCGDHECGQCREVGAVEPAEGVAQIAHRRSQHGADDVQLGGVFGVHLGRPCAGQPAAGVAPQADLAVLRQAEPLEVERGTQAVEDAVAGFVGCAPHAVGTLVVGDGDHPALGQRGSHQQVFQLGQRSDRLGAPPHRVRGEAA